MSILAPFRHLLSLGTAIALALPAPAAASPTEPTLTSEWRRPARPTAATPPATAPAPEPARPRAAPATSRRRAPAAPRTEPIDPRIVRTAGPEPALADPPPPPDDVVAPPDLAPTPASPPDAPADDLAPADLAPTPAPPPDAPADDLAPAAAPPPDVPPVLTDSIRPTCSSTACRASRPARNAFGELVAGAAFTSAGLLSLGVAARGLHLTRVSARELARSDGYPPDLVAPLYTQRDRGETMLAVGAVVGVLGLALGLALVATGARDLKAARRERPLAHLRVAPTLGGLTLAGRF